MSIKIDPSDLIGMAVSEVVKTSLIIGMPSPTAKIPSFVLGLIPTEQAQSSVSMATMQVTAGDMLQKVAVDSSIAAFTIMLVDSSPVNSEWFSAITTIIQQLSTLTNSVVEYGSTLPNFSAVTANYARSQLSTLVQMKNNAQPIYIFNSYMNLSSISQTSPYLQSHWYIDSINVNKEESENGMIVDVSVRELISKRDLNIVERAGQKLIKNIGNTISELDFNKVADSVASALGASNL